MRCRSLVLPAAAVAGALSGTARAEPACYELDPAHTTVAFLVEHAGYAKTLGRFLDVRGSYTSSTISVLRSRYGLFNR